jgi:D-lyxose ketol-isomerase
MKLMTPEKAKAIYVNMIRQAGIILTDAECQQLEIAGFGLDDLASQGLGLVIYENNARYCAKELMMLPGQTCPEHRHPPVKDEQNRVIDPGKEETFRCRGGQVWLYVEGPAAAQPRCKPPAGSEKFYTVFHEVQLNPGEQYTITPNTLHWFQAGPQGAIISEFSSTSRDELDVFTDPRIRRVD